jgi:hypothetical protein
MALSLLFEKPYSLMVKRLGGLRRQDGTKAALGELIDKADRDPIYPQEMH